MTGALRQVASLLALRWQMLRSAGSRITVALAAIAMLWLLQAVATSGPLFDEAGRATALEIAAGAFLGFGVLALVAPLTAGGGHPIFPPDELVAFPVRPATHFLAGLLLAPVNLVWVVQLLSLVALTSVLTVDGSVLLGSTTTLAFVVSMTVVGQAVAWLVVGARQSRAGRAVVTVLWTALLLSAAFVVQTGNLTAVVDATPAQRVVLGVIAGGARNVGAWWPTAAVLLLLALAGLVAGQWACAWALRRPTDTGNRREAANLRRRGEAPSALHALIAIDRASVWRAPALRRGGLVLLLLPGVVAGTLQVPWESLIVLPGLVAAGAGLLFGVNAFALDGGGALWLASLPSRPRLLFLSKLVVLSETVLIAVLVAGLAGAVRSTTTPTPTQLAAVLGSGLACAAVVIALSMRTSVSRPHHAALNDPRDAVAPPGALAAASVRLALPCAAIGMLIAASANLRVVWFPLMLALPIALTSVLSLIHTARRWDDAVVRARVVHAVARG